MRLATLLLCAIFLSLVSQAQLTAAIGRYSYEFSPPPISLANGTSIEAQVTPVEASGANWNKFRQKISLRKWDDNKTITKEVKLLAGEAKFSAFYSDLKQIGSRFWLFYVEVASGNSIGNMMAMEVNPATLETAPPKTIITSQELDITVRLMGGASYIDVKISPDQKKIGVFIGSDRGDFSITSLNENMERQWSRKASIKGIDNSEIESIAIDNKGTILLAYQQKGKAHLEGFDKAGDPVDIVLDLGGGKPKEILLLAGKKGLTIAGTYYDGSKNCTGVYKTALLPNTITVGAISKTVFPEPFLASLATDSWASTKSGKYGIEPKYKCNLIELEDGTPDITAEFRYINDAQHAVTHCGSIMNIALGEGTPVFNVMPKYCVVSGRVTDDQFATLIKGKQLIFYYYDNPENLERSPTQTTAVTKQKNQVMIAATLAADGTMKRRIVSGVYK